MPAEGVARGHMVRNTARWVVVVARGMMMLASVGLLLHVPEPKDELSAIISQLNEGNEQSALDSGAEDADKAQEGAAEGRHT